MSGKQKECGSSWTSEGEIHTCSLPEGHTEAHICGFVFNPSDCCLERAEPTPPGGEAVPEQVAVTSSPDPLNRTICSADIGKNVCVSLPKERDGIAVVEGLMRNAVGFLGSLGITAGLDTKLGLDVLEAVLYELNKAAAIAAPVVSTAAPEPLPQGVWCECGHISGHHGYKFPHPCVINCNFGCENKCTKFSPVPPESYKPAEGPNFCECPNPYEGARPLLTPRFCERCKKPLKLSAATPVTVEAPSSDIARQIAICEENGTKWAHFKVAEIKQLLATPKPIGDVEAVAERIHLYVCQDSRTGVICPCHIVVEGMAGNCFCKEETKEIVGILSPFFASAGPEVVLSQGNASGCTAATTWAIGSTLTEATIRPIPQPPCSECATLRKERDDAKRTAKLEMIERLNGWIGRVGHENYYKARAKLLEFETRAEAAEAQLSTLRDALEKLISRIEDAGVEDLALVEMESARAALAPTPEVAPKDELP